MPDEQPAGRRDELLSIAQITRRFGVSRTTLHALRSQGSFPAPEPVEGTTRLHWRESVVAQFFEANPKRQGARTDLERKREAQGPEQE